MNHKRPGDDTHPAESEVLHDLATPVMIAMGRAEHLANEISDKSLAQVATQICAQLEKIQTLIEQRRECINKNSAPKKPKA